MPRFTCAFCGDEMLNFRNVLFTPRNCGRVPFCSVECAMHVEELSLSEAIKTTDLQRMGVPIRNENVQAADGRPSSKESRLHHYLSGLQQH